MKKPDPKHYGPFYKGKQETDEFERYCRDMTRYYALSDQTKATVESLVLQLTSIGLDLDILAEVLESQHRTHQQNIGRNIVVILQALATLSYDDRNEATVRMAQTASAAVDTISIPYI